MTNALDMDVLDVMDSYKRRWVIEVYYRDCKQCLGMGEYQVRSIDVGVIHPLLSNLAYPPKRHCRQWPFSAHLPRCQCYRRHVRSAEALRRTAAVQIIERSGMKVQKSCYKIQK